MRKPNIIEWYKENYNTSVGSTRRLKNGPIVV